MVIPILYWTRKITPVKPRKENMAETQLTQVAELKIAAREAEKKPTMPTPVLFEIKRLFFQEYICMLKTIPTNIERKAMVASSIGGVIEIKKL